MKTILAFFAVVLLAAFVGATTHYVDISGHAEYTQVQPAIDAASAGDTIMISSGDYSGFVVDRRLIIIGVGTGPALREATRIGAIIHVNDAADSTELHSLWVRAAPASDSTCGALVAIHTGAAGVLLQRCFVENTNPDQGAVYTACVFVGYGCTTRLLQCTLWIRAANTSYSNPVYARTGCIVDLTACVIARTQIAVYAGSGGLITMRHCIATNLSGYPLNPFWTTSSCHAENCAYVASMTYSQCPNATFDYCGFTGALPSSGTGNISTTTAAFVSLTSNDPRASDYHLSPSSNLRDAGDSTQFDLDSTRADIGIYGGMHPYVDSGAPDYPFVLDLDVPTSVPQNGAVRVYARGRIGPGY